MSYVKAAETYRKNAVLTASPEKIIQLLYDGAIRHLERTRMALQDPTRTHSAEVGESLGKALGIVAELRTALDHQKGGEIARNLDALYEFSVERITRANVTRLSTEIEPPLRVLRTLKEAWDAIVPN